MWYKFTMPNNKVLIIEDEHDLRGLYAEILSNAGYQVEQAPDGEIGIDKTKNTDWGIMLLDIMLPGRDGLRILKEMKDNPDYKKGPVIIITNLNSEHIIQEAFNLGADGYLIKSEITPDKVIDEVKEFLK
jgi:two-component system, OmpR family, response regulator ResD